MTLSEKIELQKKAIIAEQNNNVPEEITNLINQCLIVDPVDRIEAQTLVIPKFNLYIY